MKLLVLLATCLVTLALAVPTAVRPIETLTVSRPLVHHTSTALRSRQFMPTDEWLGFYEEVVEKKCALVTIIFATGTHPRGNVGDVGLSLLVRAAQLIGRDNLVRQGVDYIGNFEHYFHGGAKDGGLEMARLAQLALSQCPDTQIVLGGYSQGAQIVHHSAHSLGPEVEDAVKAVSLSAVCADSVVRGPFRTARYGRVSLLLSRPSRRWCCLAIRTTAGRSGTSARRRCSRLAERWI